MKKFYHLRSGLHITLSYICRLPFMSFHLQPPSLHVPDSSHPFSAPPHQTSSTCIPTSPDAISVPQNHTPHIFPSETHITHPLKPKSQFSSKQKRTPSHYSSHSVPPTLPHHDPILILSSVPLLINHNITATTPATKTRKKNQKAQHRHVRLLFFRRCDASHESLRQKSC